MQSMKMKTITALQPHHYAHTLRLHVMNGSVYMYTYVYTYIYVCNERVNDFNSLSTKRREMEWRESLISYSHAINNLHMWRQTFGIVWRAQII